MSTMPVISIVDDDQTAREGTLDLVKAMGFAAEGFSSAETFLSSPQLANTRCLVADMHMPGMTGLQLHLWLVALGAGIPTIIITAFPNDAERVLALKKGVNCYLPKPFFDGELLACLRSSLGAGDCSLG
jgi:FixJ family two-component response regulator